MNIESFAFYAAGSTFSLVSINNVSRFIAGFRFTGNPSLTNYEVFHLINKKMRLARSISRTTSRITRVLGWAGIGIEAILTGYYIAQGNVADAVKHASYGTLAGIGIAATSTAVAILAPVGIAAGLTAEWISENHIENVKENYQRVMCNVNLIAFTTNLRRAIETRQQNTSIYKQLEILSSN
jgi:hypothetical protein